MPTVPGDLAALLRPDGSVVVPAEVAGDIVAAVVRDLTARARRDGLTVSARAMAVLQALHQADVRHNERQAVLAGSVIGTMDPPFPTVEISAPDAAVILGCSVEYARRLCRSGRIAGRRIGRAWLIDKASLDQYRFRRTT